MSYQPPHKRNAKKATPAESSTVWASPKVVPKVQMATKTKPEEFPALGKAPATKAPATKAPAPEAKALDSKGLDSKGPEVKKPMDFSALFKNVAKKKKPKPMKWGLIKLTKHGIVDSLTREERETLENEKAAALQEERLWKAAERLEKSQNIRREYDMNYESPPIMSVTTSEEVSTEEEEVLTDEVDEDEFEPEI